MTPEEQGKAFRAAWITGVHKHYPGEPKAGYVADWDETPDWEKQSATAVFAQVQTLIQASDGGASKLNREQAGRFVALCWIAQIYRFFPDPKPSYVADWESLPTWQQETDSDIFDAIAART